MASCVLLIRKSPPGSCGSHSCPVWSYEPGLGGKKHESVKHMRKFLEVQYRCTVCRHSKTVLLWLTIDYYVELGVFFLRSENVKVGLLIENEGAIDKSKNMILEGNLQLVLLSRIYIRCGYSHSSPILLALQNPSQCVPSVSKDI